jgi:hypothetical protein
MVGKVEDVQRSALIIGLIETTTVDDDTQGEEEVSHSVAIRKRGDRTVALLLEYAGFTTTISILSEFVMTTLLAQVVTTSADAISMTTFADALSASTLSVPTLPTRAAEVAVATLMPVETADLCFRCDPNCWE